MLKIISIILAVLILLTACKESEVESQPPPPDDTQAVTEQQTTPNQPPEDIPKIREPLVVEGEWLHDWTFADTATAYLSVWSEKTGEYYRLKRFAFNSTGMLLEYIPVIPPWVEEENFRQIALSEDFYLRESSVGSGVEFFSNDRERALNISNTSVWGRESVMQPQLVGFSHTNEQLSDGVMRDTVAFHQLIDFTGLDLIYIGGEWIDLNFDYAFDTRRLVDSVVMTDTESLLLDVITDYYYKAYRKVAELRQFTKEEIAAAGVIQEDEWSSVFKLSDVKNKVSEWVSKSARDSVFEGFGLFGNVHGGEYFEIWLDRPLDGPRQVWLPMGSRVNSDGTVTFAVVHGWIYEWWTIHFFNNTIGYQCPFDGLKYYFPEAMAHIPKIEYTFVTENGRHKIFCIE
jgi:hypothetical protein